MEVDLTTFTSEVGKDIIGDFFASLLQVGEAQSLSKNPQPVEAWVLLSSLIVEPLFDPGRLK